MDLSRHEEILNRLHDPELEQSERGQLLAELRADYGQVVTDHTTLTQKTETLEKTNADLTKYASSLFQQLGHNNPDDNQEEQRKEKAETITLTEVLKGVKI